MLASRRARGFTLVEILIVVVILGILAAIVIPQFTSASEQARASNVNSQLQAIRSQLELYQIQHNGGYPTLAQMDGTTTGVATQTFDNLITITDQAGNQAPGGTLPGAPGFFGPYLQKAPGNPFEANSVSVAAASGAGTGWVYNAGTGAITVNLPVGHAIIGNGVDALDVTTY